METTLINGRIFTSNEEQPWTEAISYENDKITYVGTAAKAPRVGNIIDLKGKIVIPGIFMVSI